MAKTTAIEVKTSAALMDWNDPKMMEEIKAQYGVGLSDTEWRLFMGIGKATKLNPFLREIWAIKYAGKPATIFVGRDGYRRSAQAHPEYEYHYAMAVHANDIFTMKNGVVDHAPNIKDSGALVGAYCVVKRKGSSMPVTTYIKASEYKQDYGVWKNKPATMAVKVAEAQGLRASFQELFAGTYEESENWQDDAKDAKTEASVVKTSNVVDVTPPTPPAPSAPEAPAKKPRSTKAKVVDAEVVDTPPPPKEGDYAFLGIDEGAETPAPAVPDGSPPLVRREYAAKITTDQTRRLYDVWAKYKAACSMPEEDSSTRRQALMHEMFGVKVSTSLNEEQGDALIAEIEKMTKEASQ